MKKPVKINFLLVLTYLLLISTIGYFVYLIIGQLKNVDDRKSYVAMINNIGIKKEDYARELKINAHYYLWAQPKLATPSSLPSDTLNNMINMELVRQYAQKNNVSVSQSELNKRYQDIIAGSKLTEDQYLAKIYDAYSVGKNGHLEKITDELLKEKVQRAVGKNLVDWLNQQRSSLKIIVF